MARFRCVTESGIVVYTEDRILAPWFLVPTIWNCDEEDCVMDMDCPHFPWDKLEVVAEFTEVDFFWTEDV